MPNSELYARYARAFAGRTGPFAWADLAAFDANAQALAARAAGKPIRLATKSIRSVPLLRRAQASSPQYQGLMCFAAREAVWLAGLGFSDLLVAYPTVGAADLQAVAQAVYEGHRITLMADSPVHLELAEAAAKAVGTVLPVCLDLDVSQDYPALRFGVHRSPVQDVNAALRLADAVGRSPHLRLDGLMAYEGQVAGIGDAARDPKTLAIRALKARAMPLVAERRARVVQALSRAGHTLRFVNGGGTGSLEATAAEGAVTEVAMGSGLLSPRLFDGYRHFRHRPAAGFALNVTRQPARNVVTCLGGGYVASGPPGWDKVPAPYLPAGLKLLENEAAGEVQTPLRVPPEVRLEVGDLVFFRHAKAGELCEHFHELWPVGGGEAIQTYRGEGQVFP